MKSAHRAILASAVLGCLTALDSAQAVVIDPGFDLFTTPAPGDPWEGGIWPTDLSYGTFVRIDPDATGPAPEITIPLKGGPRVGPFDTDTIVERKLTVNPTPGNPETVPIELVALSLRSVDPVDIGGTLFDVEVIDNPSTSPIGQMTITKDAAADGGTFNALLPVDTLVTFSQVDDRSNQVTVPVQEQFDVQNGVWSLVPRADDTHNAQWPSGGFYPGVIPPGLGPLPLPPSGSGTQPDLGKFPTLEFAVLAQHGVLPSQTPEPATLLIWSMLAGLAFGVGWRRR